MAERLEPDYSWLFPALTAVLVKGISYNAVTTAGRDTAGNTSMRESVYLLKAGLEA